MPQELDQNGLLQIVRTALLKGKSYLDIERLYNIPAVRAEQLINDYYANKAKSQDQSIQRMIAMERLEMTIEPLMDQALLGNVKASEALVKHLSTLNELLGLNLQEERVRVEIITDQQGQVIFEMMNAMSRTLLNWVTANLENVKEPGVQNALAKIEDQWDTKFHESLQDARATQQQAVIEA